MKDSKIEWTHHTFNPWEGCTKVSEGCRNCYAEARAKRFDSVQWGPNGTRRLTSASYWKDPLKWNAVAAAAGERHRVFCASLADVFEDWSGTEADGVTPRCMVDSNGNRLCTRSGEETAIQWPHEPGWRPLLMSDIRQRLFQLIAATPNLDWLLLTKRPDLAATWLPFYSGGAIGRRFLNAGLPVPQEFQDAAPGLPNIWIGTSVENQEAADERIPHLLKIPAAVRFLSMEPLLGPVNLTRIVFDGIGRDALLVNDESDTGGGPEKHIDWVIVGGESGHEARPMHPAWARSLRDQCTAAGVAFHFKQWGEYAPSPDGGLPDHLPSSAGFYFEDPPHKTWHFGKKAAGRLLDGREWNELPTPNSEVLQSS